MKSTKHLTMDEILAYANDLLPHRQLYEIGRHLIGCAECRRRLPSPTVEQFRSAIMTDWEPNESQENEILGFTISSKFSSIWNLPSVWVLGGAALVIVGVFTFLLLPGKNNSSAEIVRSLDNETNTELNFPVPVKTPDIDSPFSSGNSNQSGVDAPITRRSKTDLPTLKSLPKNDRNQEPEKKAIQNRGQISATRGSSGNCSEEKSVALEFSSDKDNFVFKWKRVPKAVKYHLYVSDDEEILIDEYETEKETSFVMKKQLDPLKTYKWKVVITLENGQTVVSSSSKFTFRDLQTNRLKPEKQKKSEIRCPRND